MIKRIFLDHPANVGETYSEHMLVAGSFGIAMLAGGLACLVHALLPCLFTATGSGIISRLHRRMSGRGPAQPAVGSPNFSER
jgi:hypothetical protein